MAKPRKQCKKCPWRKDVDPFGQINASFELAGEQHRCFEDTLPEGA